MHAKHPIQHLTVLHLRMPNMIHSTASMFMINHDLNYSFIKLISNKVKYPQIHNLTCSSTTPSRTKTTTYTTHAPACIIICTIILHTTIKQTFLKPANNNYGTLPTLKKKKKKPVLPNVQYLLWSTTRYQSLTMSPPHLRSKSTTTLPRPTVGHSQHRLTFLITPSGSCPVPRSSAAVLPLSTLVMRGNVTPSL